MKQLAINSVGGAVGVIIGLIGEWTPMLSLFFTVLVIDYISGVMAAVIEKKLSSSVGLKGLVKKFAMVLIVVLAHQLDQYAGTHLIQSGVIMFFIVNELHRRPHPTHDGEQSTTRDSDDSGNDNHSQHRQPSLHSESGAELAR